MTNYKVKLVTTEETLGTAPQDPEVYATYLIDKALRQGKKLEDMTDEQKAALRKAVEEKKQDEVAHLLGYEREEDKGITIFRRDPETKAIVIPDYMVRGFLKAAADVLTDVWAVKGKIDRFIFVGQYLDGHFVPDRWIPFTRFGEPITQLDGGNNGVLQRPLRAETMQGSRVALASSEALAAGAELNFHVCVLPPAEKGSGFGTKAKPFRVDLDVLSAWFNYGEFAGLGQWRNGSYGRFKSEVSVA